MAFHFAREFPLDGKNNKDLNVNKMIGFGFWKQFEVLSKRFRLRMFMQDSSYLTVALERR